MPRFPQLFFHQFSDTEVRQRQGQSTVGPTVSHRAAMAYIKSGVRLESKCGMSDIWYCYLDRNPGLFIEDLTSIRSPRSPPHGPHLDPSHIGPFVSLLGWREAHHRLDPRRAVKHLPEGTGTGGERKTVGDDPFERTPANPSGLHRRAEISGMEGLPGSDGEEETKDGFQELTDAGWVPVGPPEDASGLEPDQHIPLSIPRGQGPRVSRKPTTPACVTNGAYTQASKDHIECLENGDHTLNIGVENEGQAEDMMDSSR